MNGNGIPKHIVYKSYDNVEKFIPIAPDTYVFREAQVNYILNILKGDTIERERELRI